MFPKNPNIFFLTGMSLVLAMIVLCYYMDINLSISMTPIPNFRHDLYKKVLTNWINFDLVMSDENSSSPDQIATLTDPSIASQECKLPKIDPYDPSIQKHVNWRYGELIRYCNNSFKVRSKYSKGVLEVEQANDVCKARCFSQITYRGRNQMTNWTIVDKRMNLGCEFVEVLCSYNANGSNTTYAMLHSELKPIKEKPKIVKEYPGKRYSLYVIVMDSIGSSSADRTLQKTLSFMEKSFEAVKFPYLNKVGQNSRPNAVALFMGKQLEPINRFGLGALHINPDWDWGESCKRYMDNESSLFQDFRDAGYRTMLTDDWKIGMLNYPNCKGWKNAIVDHTMDTFITQSYQAHQVPNYYGKNCMFIHREDIKFAEQFINAYPDTPQFSVTWIAQVLHEINEGGMLMDNDLMLWMMANRKRLENSFLVVMADHGHRLSSISQTGIGKIDVNNPMLIMSIPKELRTPEMMATMRENAGKLQTHYDTRATFIDLLKYQPAVNFTDHSERDFEGEKGHSFFRKMSGQRNCFTLPIPLTYCMCQFDMENVELNSTHSIEAGMKLVEHVNDRLKAANLTDKCNLWKFGQVESNVGYVPVTETGLMKLVISLREPYSKAKLSGLVHRSSEGIYAVGKIDRADRYGNRGNCAKGQLEFLCDCKVQPTEIPS